MKKIFALMLALCLALAAIPTLAETDFTGTWHVVMTGMVLGTIELNADGTCVGVTTASGEEKKNNGTWTADGNAVTLTFEDQSMALTFDGTDLLLEEAAADKDMASILKFTRDAGTATVDELCAYIANGTIPEGRTKEEMEAVETQVGILFLLAASTPEEAPDYSGTWYLSMMDMSIGTFELNADGSFIGTSAVPGADMKVNGTWTANGSSVKLTVADQSTNLRYNGTYLMLSTAELNSSKEDAMIGALIKFSRTPGAITMEELNAYSSNGTIPEGKTKEEMEAIQEQIGMMFIIAALME